MLSLSYLHVTHHVEGSLLALKMSRKKLQPSLAGVKAYSTSLGEPSYESI